MEDEFEINLGDFTEMNDRKAGSGEVPGLHLFSEDGEDSMPVDPIDTFNESLENLSKINGFLAAGIYSSKGDVLAHLDRKNFNFQEIGNLAVELYTAAKQISDKMGIGTCNFVETHTEKFIFIHMCIVTDKSAMGVLLSKDGNVGLSRHQMRKEGLRLINAFS